MSEIDPAPARRGATCDQHYNLERSTMPDTAPAGLTKEEMDRSRATITAIRESVESAIVGQSSLIVSLMVGMIAGGHILLESVPGLAKTLASSSLAQSVDGSFARIQCTPDLLPSDIIGTQIFDARTGEFTTQLGPVHVNFVLLDEINRSSAKTQSAMLEAMQERQTSIGGVTYKLPDIFMVMATQNPIEEEGTYVLPQAQMDRFLLKEIIRYPSPSEEFEIINRLEAGVFDHPRTPSGVSLDDLRFLQAMAKRVQVAPAIKRYIIEIVNVTRDPGYFLGEEKARYIEFGASPRGVISFLLAARALALMDGRDHVLPEDIKQLRFAVLRHRLILTFKAVAEHIKAETLIDAIFDAVPTP